MGAYIVIVKLCKIIESAKRTITSSVWEYQLIRYHVIPMKRNILLNLFHCSWEMNSTCHWPKIDITLFNDTTTQITFRSHIIILSITRVLQIIMSLNNAYIRIYRSYNKENSRFILNKRYSTFIEFMSNAVMCWYKLLA